MLKSYFLCFILLSTLHRLCAQQTLSLPFELRGKINADSGKISVRFKADSSFYPKEFAHSTVNVKNGKFLITGFLPYPTAICLIYENGRYLSSSFIISSGTQTVDVNIDSSKTVPKVSSKVMSEYYDGYLPFFKSTFRYSRLQDEKISALRNLYNSTFTDSINLQIKRATKKGYAKSDSTLFAYVRCYPNSYLALWKLAELYTFGYYPIFDSIYSSFSAELKNTYTGKRLAQKLISSNSLTSIGKEFPEINCVDRNDQLMASEIFTRNRYTFVDFWYSNCSPCLAQFEGLKKVYADYKAKGLEIIGISTDKIKYKADWQQVIKSRNLSWPQYWDQNGKEAIRLNIFAFPCSFLLDSQGRIVAKDLSFSEVRHFLEGHL